MNLMRAVFYQRHFPDGLDYLFVGCQPFPEIADDDILVRVLAAGLNSVDWKLFRGFLQSRWKQKFPYISGLDFCGVVERIGPKCSRLKPGMIVFGMSPPQAGGTVAEFLRISERGAVMEKPKNLTAEQAACIPLAAMTALQALSLAKFRRNERILILGGSGGTGVFLIQMAKHMGASCVASTCSSRIGADLVVDYEAENWHRRFCEKDQQVDVVVDCLGENFYKECGRVLKKGGRFVSFAQFSDGNLSHLKLMKEAVKCKVANVFGPSRKFFFLRESLDLLKEVTKMVEENAAIPVIDRTYSMDEIRSAFAHIMTGRTRGKTVVVIPEHKSETSDEEI